MKTKLITITLISSVAVLALVLLSLLNQADAQVPPSPGGPGLPPPSITISECTTIISPGYYVLDRDIVDANVEQLQLVSPVPTLPGEKQSSACIFIRSSNVIFDGKGYTIDGTDVVGTYGVYVYDPSTNLTNVTVKNVVVTDWYNGIYYRNAANGSIENNTANSNYYFGIRLDSSSYNTLTNNTANSNYYTGIQLYSSSNNTLANNTANSTDYRNGISLFFSNYNTLTNNTANSNYTGIQLYSSSNNTLTNNTANSNGSGIQLESSSNNNTLTNNTANSNGSGIQLESSSNNNTLTNNTVNSNYLGIKLDSSSNNTLTNNILTNNTANSSYYGIVLVGSSSNTLTNNTISANNYGIWIYSSSENTIYNNYFNNTNNFLFEGTIYANYWNTTKTAGINIMGGPYLGGNFWANPNGTGFSQTCKDADNDGICDDPYSLNTSNVDYLSLTFPPPVNQPPTCVIKLQKDGVEIDEINVGEFFDIYVGDSTNDTGIKEVRFSSDDSQNGVPEGEWTEWYDWSTSSGDWNAETKIKRWSFTTGGNQEIWTEVKDIDGQTSQCSANIFANITLAQLIQQKEINRIAVTVEGQEYYIVTISCYIDIKTLQCLPDSSPIKVYTDLQLNPISDVKIVRKIGWIDWAREIQKESFDFPKLSQEIEDGQDKLVLFDLGYAWWETQFKALPIGLDIQTLITMILDLITGDLNKMEEFRDQAGSHLNDASSEYGQAAAVLFNNQEITDSEIARNFLEHYLLGNYHKKQAFIIIPTLYEYYLSVDNIVKDIIEKVVGSLDPTVILSTYFEILGKLSQGLEYKLDYLSESIGILPDVSLMLLCPPVKGFYYTNELAHYSWLEASIESPGELRVYDSQGNVTGLINGEAKEEISNSIYDAENETVIIFDPFDSYRYEVVGTETGTYGLEITSVESRKAISFTATDIPTTAGQNHQYIIDWGALSQGENGVTLQIDTDGDGVFDQTVTADNDLTYNEFILQTDTIIDFDPDTLNLKSKGEFVTTYIELPGGYEVSQIDIPSIMLNALVPALAKPTQISDYDSDGTPDLMVKFDRSGVQGILSPGSEIPVTITGKVFHNGSYIDFQGSDVIRVVNSGGNKK